MTKRVKRKPDPNLSLQVSGDLDYAESEVLAENLGSEFQPIPVPVSPNTF
jgi:hypothetical protein